MLFKLAVLYAVALFITFLVPPGPQAALLGVLVGHWLTMLSVWAATA